MPPHLQAARDWFTISDVREKIRTLPEALTLVLNENGAYDPDSGQDIQMARDVLVVKRSELPEKPKISSIEGQARLLHDLGSIELQAMELGVRTLVEYRSAPREFRQELADITMGESRHLRLCLDGLEDLGYTWGHWPVQSALLSAVAAQDSLLDRILIVHRYLEGAGLDAGEGILVRLSGIGISKARPIVQTIRTEEVDHVLFGSRWYRNICVSAGLDPADEFSRRMEVIGRLVPAREKLNPQLRKAAGFTEHEISVLEKIGRRLPLTAADPAKARVAP